MKKLSNELKILIGILVAACIVLVIMAVTGGEKEQSTTVSQQAEERVTESTTESKIADVEPIDLPEKSPIAEVIGFEPKQIQKLSDEFVLRNVEITETGVIYNYQKHLAANGTRLFLKIDKMTEEEYQASLPLEGIREAVDLDGREAFYADRILFKVPEGEELEEDSYERTEEKAGRAVIMRTEIDRELSTLKTLDWYENNCRYEIYVERLDLTKEEITELAKNYLTKGQ